MVKGWQLWTAGACALLGSAVGAAPARAPTPLGSPGEWITSDDYPQSALRSSAEGVTGFRLDIDVAGQVTNCTITSSSGAAALDDAVCALVPGRARFTPASDRRGRAVASHIEQRVRWQIPTDGGVGLAKGHFETCVPNDRDVVQVETHFGCTTG